jgi:hypothetical protein
MKEKLLTLLKLDAKATDDQIVDAVKSLTVLIDGKNAEQRALQDQVKELEGVIGLLKATAEETAPIKIDSRIRQKMAAGLSFQQATEVVLSQEAEDKAAKKAK